MAKLIDLIVSGKSSFANDINAKNIYADKFATTGGTTAHVVRGDGTLQTIASLSVGNADTVDSQHANRFPWIYNSANILTSTSVTCNDIAADANSNAHMGMIYSSTNNPTGATKWVHVWSQTWNRGVISSWVSQIALGVQDGTGMWYRTTAGALSSKAWTRVIDSENIGSQSVNYANSAGYSGYAQKLQIHDVRSATRTPNYFEGNRITAWFNNSGVPSSGTWYSGIHVKGWSNGYSSWELCSYSSTGTDNNYDLYFRNGINDSWGSWKTVLTDSNYTTHLDPRYLFHKKYSSLSALPSGSEGWYSIGNISDMSGSACIFIIRAYAHSSAIFTVSKGYSTSGNITVLQYCSSGNGSYAYVKGARLLSDGTVEVSINKPAANNSTYVSISIAMYNADNVKPFDVLTLDSGSPTVIQTKTFTNDAITATSFIGNASSSTIASTVTVNDSNANSTYRMVWHSGNTLYSTGGIYCNPSTDYLYASSMQTSNWFRSTGNTGWYSQTYGGGWYMTDTSWIRSYGGHGVIAGGFYHSSYGSATYLLRSDGGVSAFTWSGQSGQPTWVWGGNSQHTYYVYNPSNFSVYKANKADQLEAYTGSGFTGGDHFVRAIRYDSWHTRLYMGYYRDTTLQNTIHVGYADNATNADTLDGIHSNRFTFVYNSANYNANSGLTLNQMAADGNSNSHVGMIYAGTDNPVSTSGNWLHVWSQSWTRGSTASWCSQIALGVQQGTGMWYRTTSGSLAGRGWYRVIDSGNIGSQSVNYATSAGNADTVDGYHATDLLREFWTSSPGYNGNTYNSSPILTFSYANNTPYTGVFVDLCSNGYGVMLNTSYYSDTQLAFKRHGVSSDGGMGSWRYLIDNVTIGSQSVNYATSAGKLGTNAGSGTNPIYFSGGVPVASTSSAGATNRPVYMSSGSITACTAYAGSSARPCYMSNGYLYPVSWGVMWVGYLYRTSYSSTTWYASATFTGSYYKTDGTYFTYGISSVSTNASTGLVTISLSSGCFADAAFATTREIYNGSYYYTPNSGSITGRSAGMGDYWIYCSSSTIYIKKLKQQNGNNDKWADTDMVTTTTSDGNKPVTEVYLVIFGHSN